MPIVCAVCGVNTFKHLIDTGMLPKARREDVINHRDDGLVEWSPQNLNIISDDGKTIILAANATMLEYLYDRNLIPKEWWGREVQFHGTIFMIPGLFGKKQSCVMSLFPRRGHWSWGWPHSRKWESLADTPSTFRS